MHAGLFDVLHDAGNVDVCAVGQCVDINFDRANKVTVQQDGVVARHGDGLGHIAFKLFVRTDDFHGAATQNVGWADHQRIAHISGDGEGLFGGAGDAVIGLLKV